jgi:hypothetical protein
MSDFAGPWAIDRDPEITANGETSDGRIVSQSMVVSSEDESIGIVVCDMNYCNVWDNEKVERAASLIAAAPDLYETLNALMEIETCDKDMDEFGDDESVGAYQDDDGNILDLPLTFGHIRRARAALAKARIPNGSVER